MWSKENKEAAEQEETQVEAAPKKEVVVEAPKAITPAPKPVTRVETPAMAPKPTPVPTPKPVSVEAAVELVTPAPVKKRSLLQLQSKRQHRLLLQNRSSLL